MRTIFTKILIAGTLLTGGVASADTFRGEARDHREVPSQVSRRDFRRDESIRDRREHERFDARRDHDRNVRYGWVGGRYVRL